MPDTDLPPDAPPPGGTDVGELPTVVGIGASAGALAALKTLFEGVPADSGLAWVVVVHLSPEHESHLAELLQPHVPMPVQQVAETVPLEPNRVYVIPPNANLGTVDTHLRLSDLGTRRGERAPIDHFFRTLAGTHDGHAVGVVLTGTGSDGTLGIREIKEKGGLTVVQDPSEAEYDGMPQSAIATGAVDLVLPVAEIPEAVLHFHRTQPELKVPVREEDLRGEELQRLQKAFALIRARTGRDFTRYKRSTILRRIARRMQLRGIEQFPKYLDLLRREVEEVRALADDLLITVTSFFRDPEVFRALEKTVVPALMEGKGAGDSVRVWSVGCATGEEAYSLAILLLEAAGRQGSAPRIQIFASDLHEQSLARAREGFYPGDIAVDVSEERLRRFFTEENGGFRIRQEVRELVVFSPHNLLGDPPFSRIDLIACRNVLIYLERAIQRDVVDVFHYALRPDGFLVLGTSETVETLELFQLQDKPHCIYRRRNVPAPEPRLPVFPVSRGPRPGEATRADEGAEPLGYGSLHQRVVERYAPPSVLVTGDDRAVHLSENAGRYLVHPGGEITNNIYRLVREELRVELRSAVHEARKRHGSVATRPVRVRFNGATGEVVMDVRPATEPGREDYVLVLFLEREGHPAGEAGGDAGERDSALPESERARMRELEAELDTSKQRLQGIIEEYETSQEELRASNEELQSSNEELRSTLEELETSKEELQSMNEELQTVNQENRHKVEELSQLSGDLQNLLSATDIATLFLDRELRILRFTPRVTELFNVRLADRGRPVSDLTHRLSYDGLVEDARRVLDRLVPVEREVQDEEGRWFLARVLPYRSTEDRIEGVVVTLVDFTRLKTAEEAVRASEERQAFLLELADALRPLADPVAVQETASRVLGEHVGADRVLYAEAGPEGDHVVVRGEYAPGMPVGPGRFEMADLGEAVAGAYRVGKTLVVTDAQADPRRDAEERATRPAHRVRAHVGVPLIKGGRPVAVLSVQQSEPRAWTDEEVALVEETAQRTWAAVERAKAGAALRRSEAQHRALFDAVDEAVCVFERLPERPDGLRDYRYVAMNPAMQEMFGIPDLAGQSIRDNFPDEAESWYDDYDRVLETGEPLRFVRESEPQGMVIEMFVTRLEDDSGRRLLAVMRDVTERVRHEETMEELVQDRTRQVRELAETLTRAEQEERQRLSRLLHDDLQQLLYGIQMKVSLALEHAEQRDEVKALAEARQSLELLDRAIARTRQLTVDLNPPILRGEGLVDAIEWLRTQMRDLHGLELEIRADGSNDVLEADLRILLFQVVRELLFNVAKHARTDRAVVEVEAADGRAKVVVMDEGEGFDPTALESGPEIAGGLGLFSARERLRLRGGDLEIESAPGRGTRVVLYAPLSSGGASMSSTTDSDT